MTSFQLPQSNSFPPVQSSIDTISVGLLHESGASGSATFQVGRGNAHSQRQQNFIEDDNYESKMLGVAIVGPKNDQTQTEDCRGFRIFNVNVNLVGTTNKTFTVKLKETDTVDDLKRKNSSWTGIRPDQQTLVGPGGKPMQDGQPLINFHLKEGSTIRLVKNECIAG